MGVFLPARLFSSPSPSILIPLRSKPLPAIEGILVFSLSFQDFFSYLPPPNPLESPEIKGFREMSSLPLLGRGGGGKCLRGDFSERFFWNFRSLSERFPNPFLWKIFGKKRGKEGERGERMW